MSSRRVSRGKAAPVKAPPKPFTFDELPEDMVFSVDVYGAEGIGKTHFACTFPEVVAIADTEYKAESVIPKFRLQGKDIRWKSAETFDDIRQMVAWAIEQPDVKTVVVDSGADLVSLASVEWCGETGHKSVYPITNYNPERNPVGVPHGAEGGKRRERSRVDIRV